MSDVEQLMEYVDDAKRAAAGERVSGEPLAEFVTRVLVELRAARARLARIEPVYALARRWCNRPESVIAEGREVLASDARLWLDLRRRVETVTLDPGEAHYANGAKRCGRCGSADLEPHGMGCEIWRYTCRTCGADPA